MFNSSWVEDILKVNLVTSPPVVSALSLREGGARFPYRPKKVIFNDPATVVIWDDGEKTVVKCGENDVYDREKGLALCYMKRILGSSRALNDALKAAHKDDPVPAKQERRKKKKPAGAEQTKGSAPVFAARWIISSDGYYAYCSNCGYEPAPLQKLLPNSCPHCGCLIGRELITTPIRKGGNANG